MSPQAAGVLGKLALARGTIDRVTGRRTDQAWIDAAWQDARTRVLVVTDGRALVHDGGPGGDCPELELISPERSPAGVRFLLGEDADGVVYFGVNASGGPANGNLTVATAVAAGAEEAREDVLRREDVLGRQAQGHDGDGGARAVTLREVGSLLGDRDAGLFTHALALANWHATHTHCPRCGTPTVPDPAGNSARCPVDGSEHFPRTDPAVIMLVTDPDDRCLLASNATWPGRRVSILAGFVEPGESAEQAVAREVHEETGIIVTNVRYLGSQPWPLPRSLMLGYRADAAGGQRIVVDPAELSEANWYSRDELLASITSGKLAVPARVSIARSIIESWYGGPLPD